MHFYLIDWNSDGFKDITVNKHCGSGGCAYWNRNYSSEKKEFVYNELLSGETGLDMDTANQNIVFHQRSSYSEEKSDTMKNEGSKLVFVKGVYT